MNYNYEDFLYFCMAVAISLAMTAVYIWRRC